MRARLPAPLLLVLALTLSASADAAPGIPDLAPAWGPCSEPAAAADPFEARSALERPAIPSPMVAAALPRLFADAAPPAAPAPRAAADQKLGAERARTLLRTMVFPGWGQAALGHRTAGAIFALTETGVWASFAAFKIQQQMRRDTYQRTARLYAGIDVSGRDEEFVRIVGAYLSSDDYNRLVVYRDAANLYYDDPVKYRQYIAEHELKGADTWSWNSDQAMVDYRGQRKDMQRAALRANTALAVAVINRLISTLHAARLRSPAEPARHSWNLEVAPAPGSDATAFRCALRTRF